MKFRSSLSYLILIGILSFSLSAWSQDSIPPITKQYVRLNVSNLINSQVILGYEQKVSAHLSILGEVGFLAKAFYLETIDSNFDNQTIRTEDQKFSQFLTNRSAADFGLRTSLELRIYTKPAKRRLFIGAKTGYDYVNFGKNFRVYYHPELFNDFWYQKKIDARQKRILGAGVLGFRTQKENVGIDISLVFGYQKLELAEKEFVPNPSMFNYGDSFYNNHFDVVSQSFYAFDIHLFF